MKSVNVYTHSCIHIHTADTVFYEMYYMCNVVMKSVNICIALLVHFTQCRNRRKTVPVIKLFIADTLKVVITTTTMFSIIIINKQTKIRQKVNAMEYEHQCTIFLSSIRNTMSFVAHSCFCCYRPWPNFKTTLVSNNSSVVVCDRPNCWVIPH